MYCQPSSTGTAVHRSIPPTVRRGASGLISRYTTLQGLDQRSTWWTKPKKVQAASSLRASLGYLDHTVKIDQMISLGLYFYCSIHNDIIWFKFSYTWTLRLEVRNADIYIKVIDIHVFQMSRMEKKSLTIFFIIHRKMTVKNTSFQCFKFTLKFMLQFTVFAFLEHQ